MTTGAQRYCVRSPDGKMIVGYDDLNVAKAVALDYGDGGPALLWAVARGKADIAELLIAHGAQVNARDAEGTSALDLALERKIVTLVEVLKRAGAVETSGDPQQS